MNNLGKITYIIDQDEWLPAYPGDPLARPSSYRVEILTEDFRSLLEWFEASLPGRFEFLYPSSDLITRDAARFVTNHIGRTAKIQVNGSSDLALIKLAFQ